MKKSNIFNKTVILVAFIIISISIMVLLFITRTERAETIAKSVLTKTYGATLQDYESLSNAITHSLENETILLDYLHIMYEDQLTDNGYKEFIANRIPSIGVKVAHENNSDLKVSSIELSPKDAVEGSKQFGFTLQLQLKNDVSKLFTYTGNISLIQENGNWKVDNLSTQ